MPGAISLMFQEEVMADKVTGQIKMEGLLYLQKYGIGGPEFWNKRRICNTIRTSLVQELCESRGGCPGLSVRPLTSLLVSVDVKIY